VRRACSTAGLLAGSILLERWPVMPICSAILGFGMTVVCFIPLPSH